ncbi:cyclic nucleotide-binding domain-containing protein [Riemerella anatipestifer]|uniref:Crp/Fnr family transcriptional regulator n=1 Tax=Riemerella anatipestifer TaxID=34085 RepID=UPI001EB6990D|nr:cyclic nucleotide-binding domain-containing protein [Riemerella anatipestifer]MRM82970.1 cyclic nucleotide-binding domain-containing protein [Riemerella anatipestifer]
MDKLVKYLEDNYNISDEEIALLEQCIEAYTYTKGSCISSVGAIVDKIYFIDEGIMRAYYTGETDLEITRRFYFENDFCTNWVSFRNRIPSVEYIEAVNDVSGVSISFSDFMKLLETSTNFKNIYAHILEKFQDYHLKKFHFINNLTLLEQVNGMELYFPKLRQKISNKLLASFLHITPQHLCRVKKKLIK